MYNSCIFANCQWLGQLWKALREQADSYIKCKGVIKLPFVLVVSFTYYDKFSSADLDLLPMQKKTFESKESKANREQFEATNGRIENGLIILRKKSIKYDTRAFHEILFGKKYEK